jgi:hypothetical protein
MTTKIVVAVAAVVPVVEGAVVETPDVVVPVVVLVVEPGASVVPGLEGDEHPIASSAVNRRTPKPTVDAVRGFLSFVLPP